MLPSYRGAMGLLKMLPEEGAVGVRKKLWGNSFRGKRPVLPDSPVFGY